MTLQQQFKQFVKDFKCPFCKGSVIKQMSYCHCKALAHLGAYPDDIQDHISFHNYEGLSWQITYYATSKQIITEIFSQSDKPADPIDHLVFNDFIPDFLHKQPEDILKSIPLYQTFS